MKLPLLLPLEGLINIFNKNGYMLEDQMYKLKHYLDRDIIDYKKYVYFNEEHYCRNLIYHNHIFEMCLLCWRPGQKTIIHKHPKNGCLMKILEGKLTEERLHKGIKVKKIYKEGDILFIKGNEKHIIENISKKENLITLHIYSPPSFYK